MVTTLTPLPRSSTRSASSQAMPRGLRCRVGASAGQAADTGDRGDPRQAPAAARLHRGDEGLQGLRHADEIGVEDAAQGRQVAGVFAQRAGGDAGIGDDDVRAAVAGDEVRRRGLQRGGIGDIQRVAGVAAGKLGGQRDKPVLAPRRQSQGGAPVRRSGGPAPRRCRWRRR
jgi:hypothetical protein